MKTLREMMDLVEAAQTKMDESMPIVVMPAIKKKQSEPDNIIPNTPLAYAQGKEDALSGKPHSGRYEKEVDQYNYNLAYNTWKNHKEQEVDEDATPEAISTINDLYNDK